MSKKLKLTVSTNLTDIDEESAKKVNEDSGASTEKERNLKGMKEHAKSSEDEGTNDCKVKK